MSDSSDILARKAALRRLAQGMNLSDQSAHDADSRYAEKAWIRTGKHLRRALEEYGQEETQAHSSHSK